MSISYTKRGEGKTYEKTNSSALSSRRRAWDKGAEHEDYRQALPDRANEVQLAAADALDGEPRGRGEVSANYLQRLTF